MADGKAATRTIVITNERGLHARAAAKFTELAGAFGSDIAVSSGRERVSGRSIMGLLMLAAAKGDEITISAEGADAAAALDALCALVADGFGEIADGRAKRS